MKVAFLCLAHDNFEYLSHLSKYCGSDGDGFFLHIDNSKWKDLKLSNNTHLLAKESSFKTLWGSFNIVKATLKLMEVALLSDKYDYFLLISGSDIPLQNKLKLKEILIEKGDEISVWGEISKGSTQKERNKYYYYHYYNNEYLNPRNAYLSGDLLRRLISKGVKYSLGTFRNNFVYGKTLKTGSQWWCMSKDQVASILEKYNSCDLTRVYEFMHAPDEVFFQTILYDLGMLNTEGVQEHPHKYAYHFIGWEDKGIRNFDISFAHEASELGCLFARKVSYKDNENNINYINQLLTM